MARGSKPDTSRNWLRKIWAGTAALVVLGAAIVVVGAASGAPPPPFPTVAVPGSPAEQALLTNNAGTVLTGTVRAADVGQSWTYSFAVAPSERCRLDLVLAEVNATPPEIAVLGGDNKPIASKTNPDATDNQILTTYWTMPQTWLPGSHVPVTISAKMGPASVKLVRFSVVPQDLNGDGLPEYLARLMLQGLPPTARPIVFRPPNRPYTVFQSGSSADPLLDLQTDAIFDYSSSIESIQSWKQRSYTVWTMGGLRDGKEYYSQHQDEAQTDASGRPITAGDSY